MALRAPPRSPPFTDYDDFIDELSKQFNVFGPDGERTFPPEEAKIGWAETEIQMWFASGGMIAPPDDPKLRQQMAAMKTDIRSPQEIEAANRVKDAQKAAREASWFKELKDVDIAKADMYRDAAFALGHPAREGIGDLFPVDDPHIRFLQKTKHILPFEKHLLLWNDDKDKPKKVFHPTEGFMHGPSAALRGYDMRYYWDSSNLKVVGAVRYSRAADIGWRSDSEESFSSGIVHGGCIEAILDELTAEVMKINMAPENLTAEITFKLKKSSMPYVTYKLEAEITECSPPRATCVGRILTMNDEVVAEATAKMAMVSYLTSGPNNPGPALGAPVPSDEAEKYSLQRVYRRAASGGGGVDISDSGGTSGALPATAAETVAQLKKLQAHLVSQYQNEYFCDDLVPPSEAFGWSEDKLKDYFENGGA